MVVLDILHVQMLEQSENLQSELESRVDLTAFMMRIYKLVELICRMGSKSDVEGEWHVGDSLS